ncbi:hypothetical protein AKJ09_01822 [Labilithrix luteola]|uniref:diguanylate cyclase n=1 Tax=Labilithrix luteola TaxID=1391654 RepID=A0A0K1PNQ4_9BACT|nr:GGDEF domain-containing protein [Labilithrix luteola]AKU95158.1 hypothetical protein AKJ09_01822 [Labilithrix luteola]
MQQRQAPDAEEARQLIRNDFFERVRSDEEIDALVTKFAAVTATPYAEVLRRMLGMEEMDENQAKSLLRRVLAHRRRLSKMVGRSVHVRVAALDLLTMHPPRTAGIQRRDSRPIVVTPSLIKRALDEASADEVTGLPQRAHFMSLVRHELRQRKRRSAAVVFIDLDGFKRANDLHGHACGDEVLRMLARSARVTLRHGDVIARIGGDEFALLLLDVSEAEAIAAVTRLRERFESCTARFGTSFSAGVEMPIPGDTADSLLERADAKMYRDKRARAASVTG